MQDVFLINDKAQNVLCSVALLGVLKTREGNSTGKSSKRHVNKNSKGRKNEKRERGNK